MFCARPRDTGAKAHGETRLTSSQWISQHPRLTWPFSNSWLVCLSHLLVDFPRDGGINMSPSRRTRETLAVDAGVCFKRLCHALPHHPGDKFLSRAIRMGGIDGHGLHIYSAHRTRTPFLRLELFENLSPENRYHRFFSPVNTLGRDTPVRFTQIYMAYIWGWWR